MKLSLYEEKALKHIREVDRYLDTYGKNISNNSLKSIVLLELSDVIFEQHSRSRNYLNIVMIGIQFLMCILSVIAMLNGFRISSVTAGINIVIVGLVLVNNAIHTKEWNIAKKKLKVIEKAINMEHTDKSDETLD